MASEAAAGAATTISLLRAGEPVRGVYACVRKDRLLTRSGQPYLALELRDRTGSVTARVFRGADALAGTFERGDLVRVSGRADRFRDELVLELTSIARADGDEAEPERFLPRAYRDLDELDGFLEHLAREVHDPGLRALLEVAMGDEEIRTGLRRSPCTRAGHHAYMGGLLEHTVAVAALALSACELHARLDSDMLLAGALLHDIGRMREFTLSADFGLTEEGRLLGHLILGDRMIGELAGRVGGRLPESRLVSLRHCVLAHHGPDALPGRRFASVEALALARLNTLEAGVKGALEHGLPGP